MLWALIPTDGAEVSTLFLQMLRRYDPDIVARYGVDVSDDLWKGMQAQLSLIEGIGDHATPIWPDNIGWPYTKLHEAISKERAEEGIDALQSFAHIDVVADPTSRLLFYSWLGLLTEGEHDALTQRGIVPDRSVLDLQGGHSVLGVFDYIWPRYTSGPETVRSLNLRYVATFSSSDVRQLPMVVVCGDSFADFALFWTLRGLRGAYYTPTVSWMPRPLTDGQDPLAAVLRMQVYKVGDEASHMWGDKRILVTSASLPAQEMGPYTEAITSREVATSRQESVPVVWADPSQLDELVPAEVRYWEPNNSPGENASIVQFLDGEGLALLSTPTPKHVTIDAQSRMRWMVDVDFEGIQIPRRRTLRPLFIDRSRGAGVRLSRFGLAYEALGPLTMSYMTVESMLVRPRLRLPQTARLFERIFSEVGLQLRPSKPGQLEDECLRLMGDLQSTARQFRDPRLMATLRRFIDDTPNRPGVFDDGVRIRDRRYANLEALARWLGDKEQAELVANHYLEHGVFQRGSLIKCPFCRNADWYPAHELTDKVRCRLCSREHVYSASAEFYFRLDEVVCQVLQIGSYLSLMALDRLRRKADRSFFWMTAQDVWSSPTDERPWLEVDFMATADGRLVVGECKESGDLGRDERRQLRKYVEFCGKIRADELIAVTGSSGWSKGSLDFFASLASQLQQSGTTLVPLAAADTGWGTEPHASDIAALFTSYTDSDDLDD